MCPKDVNYLECNEWVHGCMDLGAFMCALKYSGCIICNLYKIPQRILSQPNLITDIYSWLWYWKYTYLWKNEDYKYNNKHWRVKTLYIYIDFNYCNPIENLSLENSQRTSSQYICKVSFFMGLYVYEHFY